MKGTGKKFCIEITEKSWLISYFRAIQPRIIQVLAALLLLISTAKSQTTTYSQFSPEFQLNRAFSEKWAFEVNINTTFSDTPVNEKALNTKIQGGALLFAHYYLSSRWKLSSSIACYINHNEPDIEQVQSKEWRFAVQSIYYINRKGFTLSTKMRPEIRLITNEDGTTSNSVRYRQMLKYIQPINRPILRQGTYYGIASEEILFRSTYKNSGFHHFDRNMFVVGGGYMITDDLQIELTYTNEFVPRDNGNILNNLTSFTITTNNLFLNFRKNVNKLFTGTGAKE